MSEERNFRIHLDQDISKSIIEFNGEPVHGVRSITIKSEVGKPPVVALEIYAHRIDLTTSGIAPFVNLLDVLGSEIQEDPTLEEQFKHFVKNLAVPTDARH